MAAVPRSSVSLSSITEAGMGVRLPVNAMMGAGLGTLGALVAATLKSRVAGHGIGPAFSALALAVVPTTTGAAVLFTLGSGIAREMRGANDWANDFVGGAGAGAVLAGLRARSLQSAFLGAIAFGCAGASAGVFATMQPDGPDPAKLVDKRRLASAPADFGAASANAAATQRRMA